MNKRIVIFLAACYLITLSGCGSHKHIQKDDGNPLCRKEIKEVDAKSLEIEAKIIEAKMKQEAGKTEEALALYRQVLESDNKNGGAHYEIGRILMSQCVYDSALFHCLQAAEANKNNIWYQKTIAKLYEHLQDEQKYIETWEKIVKIDPENLNNYYDLSDAYLMTNNIEKAIKVLDKVEQKVGVTEMVSIQKQKLWSAMGKEDEALKEVEKLAQSMPQEMKYSAIMAECYMKKKDYPHAKKYYDQILATHPDDEYIHISLANLYKLTGENAKAHNELQAGFANPGLDCASKLQILSTFYTTEEFYKTYAPATFQLLDTIAAHCTDTSDYALFYGDVLMRQDKYEEAYPWIRYYLDRDSSEYGVWEALLICENMMKGKEDLLMADAHRAAELFPLQCLPLYLIGATEFERKHHTEALNYLEKCRKIGFENDFIEEATFSFMAECYYRTNQTEKAWECFETFLKTHPDNIGMLNNYAYYLSEQKLDLEKAEKMSRRTIEAEPDNPTFIDTYAWILYQMGNYKEALKYIDKALSYEKEDKSTMLSHRETILEAINGSH